MAAHDCEDCRDCLEVLRRLLEWAQLTGGMERSVRLYGWPSPVWVDVLRLTRSLDAKPDAELPIAQRRVIAEGLAMLRRSLRAAYEGTREERDTLRVILRALRWLNADKEGELRDA